MTAKVVQRWLLFMFLVVAIIVPAFLPFENIFSHYLSEWGAVALLPGDMIVGMRVYRIGLGWWLTYFVALLFWGCIGYFYARWTLRIRAFHFVLLAYPVMFAVLWSLMPIYFVSEHLFGVRLGTL